MPREVTRTPRRVRFEQPVSSPQGQDASKADDEDDEMAALREALHPVLQWDLDGVQWLVKLKETTPSLDALVVATTSKYRTQDISLALWLVFFVMLPEFGLPYMWICVGNLLVVLFLQYFAQVLRPIDVDSTIHQVPACTDQDTYGFPCVDAHMSIVVLLPVMENTQSQVAHLAFSVVIIYIAATRVLLGSRFISQTLGSWVTGFTGIIVGNHGHVVVKAYKLTSGYNTAAIVLLIAFVMVVVGFWVENNESRVIGVPKADFIEVLTNIMRSDGAPATTTPIDLQRPARIYQLREQLEGREADDDSTSEESELLGRKDSFYYLMRGMRARARAPPPPQPL